MKNPAPVFFSMLFMLFLLMTDLSIGTSGVEHRCGSEAWFPGTSSARANFGGIESAVEECCTAYER